eukprot:4775786-Pleurochrysis_carterae.AAC.1
MVTVGTVIISREGSQGDNPSTKRPGRGSPLALASCECAPRAGVRGVSQGGQHPCGRHQCGAPLRPWRYQRAARQR